MRVPQWTIKARLILTLGLACSLLAAVGLMGVRDQQHSNVALRDMYMNKLVPATELGKLLESYGSDRAAALRAASSHNAALVQKAEQEVSKDRDAQHADWKRISSVDLSDSERAVAKHFAVDRARLEKDTGAALSAMQASDYKKAEAILDGGAETHYQAIKGDVLKLFDLQSNASAQAYKADEARAHLSKILSLSAIGTGLGASQLLSILLIRSLTRSLDSAVRVADSIADGQLDNRIEIRSDDELGRLLKALQRMDHRLTEICGEVSRGSSAVSVAAGQIAQGTDDLSQRTQEQASSLEETAASMEEMTSTVKHNADNAAQADQLARGARRQAEEGGEVVREAVDAMNAVSESSKRIADIVGLIDEIAFQTNLLSLNAAVEAARAGEQGRGFAVVATEVRNLAQRSANAAREIKTLINDSVERVRVGQGLVDRSGVTLSEIVESVKKVTDIVAEMAAASAEQSTGIDQVNTAVMTMDEVTQQNSALVEESAAASRAMQEQADALLKTVGYFRFDERQAGRAEAVGASRPAAAASARGASTEEGPVRDEHGQAVARMVEEALVAG